MPQISPRNQTKELQGFPRFVVLALGWSIFVTLPFVLIIFGVLTIGFGAEKVTLECQRLDETQPDLCILKSAALLRRQTISVPIDEVSAQLQKSIHPKTGIASYKAVLYRQSSVFSIDCCGMGDDNKNVAIARVDYINDFVADEAQQTLLIEVDKRQNYYFGIGFFFILCPCLYILGILLPVYRNDRNSIL